MFEELEKWILEIEAKGKNPEEFLNKVGKILGDEIKENINLGGRPEAFPSSIRVKVLGGKTLIDTGSLYRSIGIIEKTESSVEVGPTEVGKEKKTDPRILGYLHEGGTIKGDLYFKIPLAGSTRLFAKGKVRSVEVGTELKKIPVRLRKPKKEVQEQWIHTSEVKGDPHKWAFLTEETKEKIVKEFDKFILE